MLKNTIYKYRYFIKSVCTYSVLYPSANYVQQKFFRDKKEVDFQEVKRYWIYGTCISPTFVFAWQKILNSLFPQITTPYVVLKVCLDQFCFAPFIISFFFLGMGALESKTIPQIKEEYAEKFVRTYMSGMVYWSVVQSVNFRFVPFGYRTVYTSFMTFFWTIGLSYIKSLPVN